VKKSVALHQVVKSNHVIEASYRLSIAEQRIVLFCITQIRRDQPMMTGMMYRVHASEIAQMAGLEPSDAYRDLVEAADRLFRREVTLYKEPDGTTRPPTKRRTRWVQTIDYIDGAGYIELCFGEHILPYLSDISENFTRYPLGDVMKMTSGYAVRLYELLIQRADIGRREIALDDLRVWLDTGDSYPLSADLRRWVIEPALKQVNEHSPLTVTCTARRTGRSITHLLFNMQLKSKAREAIKKPKQKRSTEEIINLARPGEAFEDARIRLGNGVDTKRKTGKKTAGTMSDLFEKLTDTEIFGKKLAFPCESMEEARTRLNGSPVEVISS
jgi:plasmid replication initiation protein